MPDVPVGIVGAVRCQEFLRSLRGSMTSLSESWDRPSGSHPPKPNLNAVTRIPGVNAEGRTDTKWRACITMVCPVQQHFYGQLHALQLMGPLWLPGLKHFLANYPNEFAIEGTKGCACLSLGREMIGTPKAHIDTRI